MSINRSSTIDDICTFLKSLKIKDTTVSKFKEEKIKGNELFYLIDQDYEYFKIFKLQKKNLQKKLEEIKVSVSNILDYKINIDSNSKEEEVYNFLKTECHLEENILEKFKDIKGQKFQKLKEQDLKNIGLKLGERRKILSYISSMKSKINNVNNNNIISSSTIEEVCSFLKYKFNLSEEILNIFRNAEIDGNQFFELGPDDLSDLSISEEIQREILNYINTQESEEEEEEENDEQIDEEEKYKHFELINIIGYSTSEGEYNKCPYNKKEGFIELCNFMGIKNKENCETIDFDQANKIKLKVSTIWGSIEALFEFFESKKMYNTIEYFKNNNNKLGGIYLLIKEDKSFGYIIIWPGKMNYLYKKLEEPQKDLLLSLVRIGFSLSDNNIICLTEKQKNEFDFQAIKIFNKEEIPEPTEGQLNILEEESYFKLGEDLEIKYDFDEKITNFKLNNSSLFFYIPKDETLNPVVYDKISKDKLNYNVENVIISKYFELSGSDLYDFLVKFNCLRDFVLENDYLKIDKKVQEKIRIIKLYYIDSLDRLINNFKNTFRCEFCRLKGEKDDDLYAFSCDNHCIHISHYDCLLEDKGNKKYREIKGNKKEKILIELLSFFYQNCETKYKKYSLLNKKIDDYLNKIKNFLIRMDNRYLNHLKELFNDLNNCINTECRKLLSEKDDEICKLYNNWKNNIINNIKNVHYSKYNKINSWYEYTKAIYDSKEKKYYFSYIKYTKNNSKDIIKLFNIIKYNNENYYILKNCEEKKWNKNENDYEFENYFDKERGGILIKKSNDSYRLNLGQKIIRFNNCYDYYKDILIISRIDEVNKVNTFSLYNILNTDIIDAGPVEKNVYINIFYLDEENNVKYNKGHNFNNIGNILRIKIVPYSHGSSPKYALLFTENIIYLIIIEDFQNIYSLKLKEIYKGYNIDLFQFLVYEKFLLIFFYDNKKVSWDFDVFEIDSDKITRKAKIDNNLNFASKKGEFSICNIKDNPILCFCYLEMDKFHIKLKKVLTSVSNLIITSNSNDDTELNLTEGNCVLNYFYHVFIKYPALGALQHNYYNSEKIKNIYIYSKGLKQKQTKNYKNYLKELKEFCINQRQLNPDDIKYEFKGIFKKDKVITSISLDDIIIKFIQVIPLQIAKIKNYYFKAMSNGKDIKKEELYEKFSKNINDENVKISIEDYAKFINFGMKNSIFNYYDLPVVVLAFMGAQSIGKSTLSNELVESFFNVSGMRCTEGIWMAISLFKGNKTSKKCEGKCQCCNEEMCRLFIHSGEIQCICDKCCCDEICCLFKEEPQYKKENDKLNQNFCFKRCALPLGHINMCVKHNNKKCEKHRNKCECGKNKNMEKHICEISPYNHGFLCVSLDFEGLGTFERSLEQDIDLSMVGAALANSLILRADKTFDTFMQSRMIDWSEGSKKIKNFKNTHYFGGNIIFCQKDIPNNNFEEVKREYEQKMIEAIKRWMENENKYENKDNINANTNIIIKKVNNKQVFGIFSKYINSPTPIFNKNEFYKTLRNMLIHLIIKNVLMNKSFPYYGTGQEFMLYLQGILATVDIHDYNALENLAVDNLKKYLSENRIKAIEIFGIYPNKLERNDFNDIDELENYLNLNLEKLRTSYISNSKRTINETLSVDVVCSNLKIEKLENIKYKNYIININVIENKDQEKSKKKINSYKLIIEGIKEFGLLLLIPSEYKEIFEIESIRQNLSSLWRTICYNLNFTDFEIITNFKAFISEIIKRRENNIDKWIDSLTSSFAEINTKLIKKNNFSLEERWKICGENCHKCYYPCTKIIGHAKEHDCEFDHICHEKCQICENFIKCDEKGCDLVCKLKKAGHDKDSNIPGNIIHICSHFHKCQKNKECYLNNLERCTKICQLEFNHEGNCYCKSKHLCDKECIYKNDSKGCKIKCREEINHKGEHICESNEHLCTKDCSLKKLSKGCINNGKCSLKLPHENCQCKGKHYCIKDCSLKDKSRGCGEKCILPYGHYGDCICDKKHKCKEECNCKNKKVKECKGICALDYGHDKNILHNCGEKHFCDNECSYITKARNCKKEKKCILEFNHKEICTCGSEHLCSKPCSINNCKNFCNLLYEHQEKNCDCKEYHICLKECFLLQFSKENTCKGKCKQVFGHKGNCVCEILPENHKCNKKCSSKQCIRKCILNANHKEKCLCGEDKCDFDCQYKTISRNCQKKCGKNMLHEGPHQCEEKNHLCNKDCDYKVRTKKENGGCLGKCKLPAGHEGDNHFCENEKEKHKCAGECSLKSESSTESCNKFCDKSIEHKPPCICNKEIEKHICKRECELKSIKGCKIVCCLPVYHDTKGCLCSIGKDGHLCNKTCSLKEKTKKGCKDFCSLKYNHEGPCFCSAKKEDHRCNGTCSLKEESREEGCFCDCKFSVNHSGDCLCQNSVKNHICNKICSLKKDSNEESCFEQCSLNTRHKGNCICCSKKHICGKDCDYKNISRFGCFGKCSKKTGHDGEHICYNQLTEHKCNKRCHLAEKSRLGCNELCDKFPGHSGNCLCDSKLHKCNRNCYLSDICHKGILKFCDKDAGHEDEHDCLKEEEHICIKHCELENKSRECKIECSLPYNHKELCICKTEKDKHLCLEKCELCKLERFCENKYGHDGHHLCNNEHNCLAECEEKGICEIITTKGLSKKKKHVLKNKEIIEFEEKSEQTSRRLTCHMTISPGEIGHGKHKCEILIHKCGYKCKQCERMCNLEYGHQDLHDCEHGHINNSVIFTEENSANLNYLDRHYDFQNDEPANIFTCYQYCKEQGTGHIHILDKCMLYSIQNLDINISIQKKFIKEINDNLYACKCEFFWKNFLKFKFDDKFDIEQKKSFNKCSAECPLCKLNYKKINCELELWHEPDSNSNINDNFWISRDGHRFTCQHPIPCHTIFIVDKSGSMGYDDITPSLEIISKNKNFNNRFGHLIENIDNYIKKRKSINKEDVFSLISFSDRANIIFKSKNCDSNEKNFNFIKECVKKIGSCQGETEFYLGFKLGEEILKEIDRTKHKPVIILFSDGEDQKKNETITIVKRVSKFILIIYFY